MSEAATALSILCPSGVGLHGALVSGRGGHLVVKQLWNTSLTDLQRSSEIFTQFVKKKQLVKLCWQCCLCASPFCACHVEVIGTAALPRPKEGFSACLHMCDKNWGRWPISQRMSRRIPKDLPKDLLKDLPKSWRILPITLHDRQIFF